MEWTEIETFAGDLEAFATHAKREEVTAVDVSFCSTKNEEIVGHDEMLEFQNAAMIRFIKEKRWRWFVCSNNQGVVYYIAETAAVMNS